MDEDIVNEHWPPNAPQDADIGIANAKLQECVLQYLHGNTSDDIVHVLCDAIESGKVRAAFSCSLIERDEKEKNLEIRIFIYVSEERSDIQSLLVKLAPRASAKIINQLPEENRVTIAHDAIVEYLIAREEENGGHEEEDLEDEYDLFGEDDDADAEDEDTDEEGLECYFAQLEEESPTLFYVLRNIHRRIIEGTLDENAADPEEE